MFASRSLLEHLLRGVVGIGVLGATIVFSTSQPWVALVGIPVALIALRGCPMCWTMGLVETVAARLQGKAADSRCLDGSCAARTRGGAATPRGSSSA